MNKMLYNQTIMDRSRLIDIEDRGYQFGDGVYEVIGVYDGDFFLLDDHLRRLKRSAEAIQMMLPCPIDTLKDNLKQLVTMNQLKEGVVYLQISRGVAERWHQYPSNVSPVLVAYTKVEETMKEEAKNGAKAIITEDIRWLRCDIKTLNLLPNVMAKQKAVENNAVEAILHREGIITEASASNVFIVKDNCVMTHPANHFILNGITRMKILELCYETGILVRECAFTIDDLRMADEVFISATKLDIVPIVFVNDHKIGTGEPGEITREIINCFAAAIQDLSER
ncbi:D-amino-acid transaminase [Virgibacillus sp. Bac332]|uniref:D-amino-acid transaminase n=1 Tax=Virgibacillus sp. Bac332 TaxID=2419842 RepID=UPI000EF49021|nr:D-amino-acid transaminase [Virgibacillus sp. Bac332]